MKAHKNSNYPSKEVVNQPYGLEQFFDEVLGNFEGIFGKDMHPIAHSTPKVNIWENDEAYVLELAAAGWEKSDFSIELEKNTLIVSAERQKEEETSSEEDEKGKPRFIRQEFVHNSLKRSFQLPEDVEESNISAQYENGILSITLPKVDRAKWVKSIEVK